MLQFKKPDPNKVKERARVAKEAQQASDEAIGAAQNCLNAEIFKKYRDQYEQLEKKMIIELIEIDKNEFDPIRYGFSVKDIISKYRIIGGLLRGVNSDAGK